MAEFALLVPIFMAFVFGFVEFSIILFGYCNAAFASEVGVRYAIMHGQMSGIPATTTQITNVVTPFLWGGAGGTTITTTWTPNNTPGSTVKVLISIQYKTGIPFSSLSKVTIGTAAQGTIVY